MQLPEPPPPPLAPLWDRVLRAQALPPDLDVELLYIAIRDRLIHPEWEVRLHALRVLADLLPLSGNALSFPFDQVVDNLGHSSPNVRKAALDALKVFCSYCEDTDCAARAISDKCSYNNIRPHSANIDNKVNVITGLILSLPSVMAILKRRNPALDTFPIFKMLGEKLFDPIHRDVALRSMIKFRRVTGPNDYMASLSMLDTKTQDKFRVLCEMYDEDSFDVYYAPRKSAYRDARNHQLVKINEVFNNAVATPMRPSTDSSSEDSFTRIPFYSTNGNFAKVIIETEIKFDSDTAITMTVLEENETESERNTISEDDYDSSDRNMLRYSDGDSEDMDVVVKKVRFGGESVKIRTPDSDNLISSEDDNNSNKLVPVKKDNIDEVSVAVTPFIVKRVTEIKREAFEREAKLKPVKKSGIPLPVIQSKIKNQNIIATYNTVKLKSKSLSELYDYFRTKNEVDNDKIKQESRFSLTLSQLRSPEKIPSPVETHREVEVLHNLQRSPVVSPRRKRRELQLEHDGFVLNILASSSPNELDLLSPRPPSPLRLHYAWEELDIVPKHVAEQLHNTENWIAAVKAADHLHSTLLEANVVKRVEPAATSLIQHMWALSDAVPASRAPAEGAVCALIRESSNDCARNLLPSLIARMGREPLPAALPHALLQRLALHHLVDLIFDPVMIGVTGDTEKIQSAQLRAALCLARAAGPAAVLSAVRRRLAGTARADAFCNKLRNRLSRPVENIKPSHVARISQLPVPVRRRARSTPPPAAPIPPRRLRPLPDSAPLPGVAQPGRDYLLKRLSPIPLSDRDSSAFTNSCEEKENSNEKPDEEKRSPSNVVVGENTEIDIPEDEVDEGVPPPRSPSIQVEDYSSNPSIHSVESRKLPTPITQNVDDVVSQKSLSTGKATPIALSRRSSPIPSKSRSASPSPLKSRNVSLSPEPTSDVYEQHLVCDRDVRSALAECIVPVRHEDWEVIVNGLTEIERLAVDPSARAPAASWRAVARSAAGHVRSLRSRVARTACTALGALFEHRGRALDTELEEAASALLERCADVNRFLRADAASALVRIACGSHNSRAAVALARKGASHRAGPVRAAAAQALAKLVQHNGASRILDMSADPRTILLKAAGELLADAHAETRVHARTLCLELSEDIRFKPMLKEAMQPTRYRAIEKFVDRLRCR